LAARNVAEVAMKYGLVSLLVLSCVATTATAAPRCYLTQEIEADQAVQFQTELMVVSDTCKVPSYTDFSRRNRGEIVAYQHALMERFRRGGERHADTALETYLTHLANEVALRSGQMPPATLCAQSATWLTAADAYGPEDFHHLAAARAVDHRASYVSCER
jgi:hypothetical protein